MKKCSLGHEWVFVKEGVGTVGIADFAQKELGTIVYVQLPKMGAQVKAGQEAVVLESTKAATDVYSPVSGKIIAVNEALALDPELINREAEGAGWLFRLQLSDLQELDSLTDYSDYYRDLQN